MEVFRKQSALNVQNRKEDEIKKMVAVMLAYSEGKVIEYRAKNDKKFGWHDSEFPKWNWQQFDYRIKEIKVR